MKKCVCGNDMTAHDWEHRYVCHRCGRTKQYERPITNFDRIKSMSIEELAEFLNDMQNDALFLEGTINDLKYPTDWMEYLESEV